MASETKLPFSSKVAGAIGGDGVWLTELTKFKEKLKLNSSMSSKKTDQLLASKRPGPMRSRSLVKLPRTYPYSIPQRQDRVPQRNEIVKQTSDLHMYEEPTIEIVTERQTTRRPSRTPSPPSNSSEFLYLSKHVNRHPMSPGRNHSPKRTRTRSRSPNNRVPLTNLRRSPSRGSGDLLHVEAVKSRIKKVENAKLYLLRQPGPHSFTVASGKSAENTYKVSIGPQTCTCGHTKSCIHVLFVMLRVFRVSETEPCLFSKTLKNYEVESLFRQYHQRLQSRLKPASKNSHSPDPDSTTENENDDIRTSDVEMARSRPQSPLVKDLKDDVDLCAICLLPMLECESLVACDKGCKNRLHQLCMDIWSDECIRQNDTVICPLCRCSWSSNTISKSSPPHCINDPRPTVAMSPSTVHPCQNDFISSTSHSQPSVRRLSQQMSCEDSPVLPSSIHRSVHSSQASSPFSDLEGLRTCAKTTPVHFLGIKSLHEQNKKQPVYVEVKQEWKEIFGGEIASDVQARGWATRENALKKMIAHVEDVMERLGNDDSLFDVTTLPQWLRVTETFADVLSVMVDDPVFKNYHLSLRGLVSLLGYYICVTEADAERVQNLVKPIVRTILTKCADGNSRTAHLSIDIITILCYGQTGEMAVGKYTNATVHEDICGFNYILHCIMETDNVSTSNCSWQRTLGRLYALDELMDVFPQEFHLLQVQDNKENMKFGFKKKIISKQPKLINCNRIMSILGFSLRFLKASHSTVRKMAERVYVRATRLTSHVPSVYTKACQMLSRVDETLQNRLRDRTPSRDSFFPVSSTNRHTNDERVLYTSVQLPSRRHSLGRPVPASPSTSKFRGREFQRCSTPKGSPITDRRLSLPLFQRSASESPTSSTRRPFNTARNYSLSPTTKMDISDEEQLSNFVSSRPRRPNFLPLKQRFSLEEPRQKAHIRSLPRRHSSGNTRTPFAEVPCAGGDGTPCCYNRICHVHALPCDGNCHEHDRRRNQRFRPPPSVPPNTPQCPVGDLIDLSAPVAAPPMSQHPSLIQGVAMSLLDAIPEANSANLLALKCQSCYPDSSSSLSPTSPRKHSMEMDCDLFPDFSRLLPAPQALPDSSSQHDPYSRLRLRMNGSDISSNSSYVEGEDWVRCEVLGNGGFSTCFLGRDRISGALMAVKQVTLNLIDEADRETRLAEIREEIKMMMRLQHPNIVRLLGASQQEDHYNVFVEWMPGGSVAASLNKFGRFSDRLIANYTKQVLTGLDYLHDNCIVHRDLKGANLLIDSTGLQLRIADFGTAKKLATQTTLPNEFSGDMLGTIAFMAPEVLRGESYGRKCDVWSVGCCVIEMVTTKPPWDAGNFTNNNALIYKPRRKRFHGDFYLLIAIAGSSPPIPDCMSDIMRDFAELCLRTDLQERPMVKDLQTHPFVTILGN